MSVPPEVVSSIGLIGGYLVASKTRREYGGAVLAASGAIAAARWKDVVGGPAAAALGVVYTGAFGASHPLAKKIGPWRSVFAAAAAVTGLSLIARKVFPQKK